MDLKMGVRAVSVCGEFSTLELYELSFPGGFRRLKIVFAVLLDGCRAS